eukprot:snap_masked-scaffold_5-processed-gene-12.34-mRNA-1 protein AED:1.00 eAED:1.00 QI:0/-1/0/0/-1/1/1/0/282
MLIGKKVILSGLSRKELNGRTGKTISYDKTMNRYHVELWSCTGDVCSIDTTVAIKEENLLLFQEKPSGNSLGYTAKEKILEFIKSFGEVFDTRFIGVISSLIILGQTFSVSKFNLMTLIVAFVVAENYLKRRSYSNILTKVVLKHNNIENNVSRFFQRNLTIHMKGKYIFALAAVLYSYYQATKSGNSYSGYSKYDYDDYSSPYYLSVGGYNISWFSLLSLGLMIYMLDIPNKGLGALRNMNFFQVMYLVDLLQRIFGGVSSRRRGYSPMMGGYGRRRGMFY